MSDFETLKAGLKDKWLDYYEANQAWIKKLDCWVYLVRGSNDKRPNSYFMLGVISFIEPNLKDYLIPLCSVNSNGEQIIEALELHFDPNAELKKRAEERSKQAETQLESQFYDPELERIRREIQTN